MTVYDEEVSWDTFDSDIEKLIERKYPGAEMQMMSEAYVAKMGERANHHACTYEGEWKGEWTRINFTATQEADEKPKKRNKGPQA